MSEHSNGGNGNGKGKGKVRPGPTRPMNVEPIVVDEGTSPIALAAAAEYTGHSGRGPEPRLGPLRRFWTEIRDYKELRKTPYGLKPAVLIGLIGFFAAFDSAGFRIAGPVIARQVQINIGDIIDIQVMIGVIAVFATIAVGYAADRTRRLPYVAAGTFFQGVFGILMGRGRSFAGVAGPRIVNDVSGVAASVPEFSLLADYYPPEARGRVFAMLGTLARVGQTLAIPTMGALLAWYGLGTTYVIIGVPMIFLGVILLFVLREPVRGYMERRALGVPEDIALKEDEPQSLGESWRTTFGIRTLRRLIVAGSVGGVGDDVYSLFFPFFLFDKYGLDVLQTSLVLLPAALARLVGGIYGGGLIDRFTARSPAKVFNLFAWFNVAFALGVLVTAFKPPLVVLVGANALVGFGGALTGPARSVVFANVIPASIRTTGLQITALGALPGLILAGTLGGAVFARYGNSYNAVFLFAFPFLLLDGLIAFTAGAFYDLDMRSAAAAAVAEEEWRKARRDGNAKLLVCRGVDVDYSGVQVLFDVDFDVEEGEIIALLGTNGAGKSTLLRAISGIREASGGGIIFDGRDITHMPPHEIAARGVVHMPGGRGVFPDMSVRENLVLANWLAKDLDDAHERMAEVFEIFPVLQERADVPAGLLSGGEQQQLSLAQAFLARPRLLLIDELSLGLSPAVVAQLIEVVKEIHRRGVTIVIVEQSVNVALQLAQKAIFMEKGEVRFFGDTEELLDRPDIIRAVYMKGSGALTTGAARGGARNNQKTISERAILECEGLVKRFGGINAVDGATFQLFEGEVLGLIGPNGAGKTSIFDLVSGFQIPDEGKVIYDGVDVTHATPEARARMGLIRRFQDASLFGSLTVFETLLVALEQQLEVKSTLMNAASMPQARRAERRLHVRAERLIELLELHAYRDKFVKDLSTGLRRVVDLACVLGAEPKVLLLDEPSTGIAQAEAENLGPLLRRAQHETGCSILIIEHDMSLLTSVADELLALELGQVVTRGTPDEVLSNQRVVESYLGTELATINRSGRT